MNEIQHSGDAGHASKCIQYTIAIAHYNNGPAIESSLLSILNQIDDNYEVVVVDNYSNDGSEKVLERYAREGRIRLIKAKSNRGQARQIALENSKGKFILAHFDLDDVFNPMIKDLCSFYIQNYQGYAMRVISTRKVGYWQGKHDNFIAPRDLLNAIGGWSPISYGEYWDIFQRLIGEEIYVWIHADLIQEASAHDERKGIIGYCKYRFAIMRSDYKAGIETHGEKGLAAQESQESLGREAK